ncbi:MAG: 2-dehydropantoate 2-reductase [Clostridiales bacterium]|nr:2-dehydropantoate 2-reductase [Clostridiales bacterium]MCD8133158.1 2-dehydropantoate 2-reductase [Clostridiales bacterium]
MGEIKTVAVMGSGAVGAYFIWGLSEKLGENLWVIADGERRERYERDGIHINDKRFPLHLRTSREAKGVDLLLIATKYDALLHSLNEIKEIVDDHTIVMTLLNGVDSEALVGKSIGEEHMVYSLMQIASQRKGNRITFSPERTPGVFFGEKDGIVSGRINALADLFKNSEIHYCVCHDIVQEIWKKMAFNVSMNLPQAIVGCPVGAFAVSEHMAILRWRLRDEVCRVAAALGIDITELSEIEKAKCPSLPSSKYSTLQDLEAGRHTEIEMFAGTLIRIGKQYHVPTPFCEFACETIKALEEKNDGLYSEWSELLK